MTTAKSIPGLLRKLADTIERAMGVKADEDSDRRRAQTQRNAEALQQRQNINADPRAIAKAVVGEMDRRERTRSASKFHDAL